MAESLSVVGRGRLVRSMGMRPFGRVSRDAAESRIPLPERGRFVRTVRLEPPPIIGTFLQERYPRMRKTIFDFAHDRTSPEWGRDAVQRHTPMREL
jgi:hypothetical protein